MCRVLNLAGKLFPIKIALTATMSELTTSVQIDILLDLNGQRCSLLLLCGPAAAHYKGRSLQIPDWNLLLQCWFCQVVIAYRNIHY